MFLNLLVVRTAPFALVSISLACLVSAQPLTFEVASIRPHAPDDSRFGVKMPANGHFAATGVVAKLVAMLAYDVQDSEIAGGPDWFATEKWDIEAKSEEGGSHSVEQTRQMMQSMLADRFALRVHRKNQERPVYVLTVRKGGPKFKAPQTAGRTNFLVTRTSITLERGDIGRLAQFLSTSLGRPVVDRTGLAGSYDLSLQWDDAPVPEGGVPGLDGTTPAGNDHGSIFTAIQDQLGLRLESQRAPVEVIVVDRAERPSEN